jgi:adenylate cyclase
MKRIMSVNANPPPQLARRLRAVLFVDVVGSVRLIQQDQEGTIQRWREYVAAVDGDDIRRCHGRIVKVQGDGLLVEFESAIAAVECALSMQARLERSESGINPDHQIKIRIGIIEPYLTS